jgi:hypothetical protein
MPMKFIHTPYIHGTIAFGAGMAKDMKHRMYLVNSDNYDSLLTQMVNYTNKLPVSVHFHKDNNLLESYMLVVRTLSVHNKNRNWFNVRLSLRFEDCLGMGFASFVGAFMDSYDIYSAGGHSKYQFIMHDCSDHMILGEVMPRSMITDRSWKG